MTHTNLPTEARETLLKAGEASKLVLATPFVDKRFYPPHLLLGDVSGIDVLDRSKRFDDSTNFNQLSYVGISSQFGRDAIAIVKAFPAEYASSVARNVATFLFRSPTDYRLVSDNLSRIERWDAVYSVMVYGQLGSIGRVFGRDAESSEPQVLKQLPLREVVLLKAQEACIFVALAVLVLPVLALRKFVVTRDPATKAIVAFMFLTFGYVFAVTNLANFGEAHRMRYEVEPILVIWFGWFIHEAMLSWQRRQTRLP